MDERAVRVLEYNKIMEMLSQYAVSESGRKRILSLKPSRDVKEIERLLDETTEAESLISYLGENPMDEFPDIMASLKRADIGGILNSRELLDISQVLKVSQRVKRQVDKYDEKEAAIIRLLVCQLKPHKDLYEEILRCIEAENSYYDDASPALAGIRRQIKQSHGKIRDRLNSIVHSPHFQKYLQEPIVTVRNDRYVVPVKQEHRSSVPGLIHDQSGSGATLFIEPMSVVEANNELKELAAMEKKEIDRILAMLTAETAKYGKDILHTLDTLIKLDIIFAKGSLSATMIGVRPKLVDGQRINIINGRHPLILPEQVIPVSIGLGYEYNTLVITGPNTGGKTVTLKTVGLFVMMTQTGLHIPADYGTEMGVFEEVYADIGDEQSIEQSLSTFSSHMTNIIRIVNNLRNNSLVLFDELGAGTDPTEGAALGMAILDFLHQRSIRTIATTHYSELKIYALTQNGMENAAMEFDIETLRPTYRLIIGVPGKSNAFEISRRLGLGEGLIEKAKEFLSKEDIRFEDVISNMEKDRMTMQRDQQEARAQLEYVKELRQIIESKNDELKSKEKSIIQRARQDAKKIIQDARHEAEDIIKELRQLAEQAEETRQNKAIEQARKRLTSNMKELRKNYTSQLKQWISDIFAREPEWEDLENNTEKIQFLYRRFILGCMMSGYQLKKYLTPNETALDLSQWNQEKTQSSNELISAYNQARYGDNEISNDTVQELADLRDA